MLYVGSHGSPNALQTIIDAAKHIQETNKQIKFRFVGDGNAKVDLQQYAVARGVNTISFDEAVPREQIPALLSSADILVANIPNHPLYKYGVSLNKLYEYLASGKPIALASSAANDPVSEAGVGPVVPADDSLALAQRILELASLPASAREELGAKGMRFVEKEHASEVLAKRVLVCMQKAMGQ